MPLLGHAPRAGSGIDSPPDSAEDNPCFGTPCFDRSLGQVVARRVPGCDFFHEQGRAVIDDTRNTPPGQPAPQGPERPATSPPPRPPVSQAAAAPAAPAVSPAAVRPAAPPAPGPAARAPGAPPAKPAGE